MKFNRFIAASLTVIALCLNASGQAEACDKCHGRSPCRACGSSDDRGLLDALNMAAQRTQPRLPRLKLPQIPSLDTALRRILCGPTGGSSCATCGCELTGPSCGCELTEPSCGCEITEPSCGCESAAACDRQGHAGDEGHYQPHQQFHAPHSLHHSVPSQAPPQLPPPTPQPVTPYATPQRVPHVEPYMPSQPNVPHNEKYRMAPPPERQPTGPAPLRSPEMVPLPDSEVDPFRDDAATRVRRIPSRTIQYRQNVPAYGQSYDPQARHDSVRMRMTDDAPLTSPQVALDERSSRRVHSSQAASPVQTEPAHVLEPRQPEVVTASGETRYHSSSANSQPNSPTNRPIELRNPLRGN